MRQCTRATFGAVAAATRTHCVGAPKSTWCWSVSGHDASPLVVRRTGEMIVESGSSARQQRGRYVQKECSSGGGKVPVAIEHVCIGSYVLLRERKGKLKPVQLQENNINNWKPPAGIIH